MSVDAYWDDGTVGRGTIRGVRVSVNIFLHGTTLRIWKSDEKVVPLYLQANRKASTGRITRNEASIVRKPKPRESTTVLTQKPN